METIVSALVGAVVGACASFFAFWELEVWRQKVDETARNFKALRAVLHELSQLSIKIEVQKPIRRKNQPAYPLYLPINLSTFAWHQYCQDLPVGEGIIKLYEVYSHVDAVNEIGKISLNSDADNRILVSEQQMDYLNKTVKPNIQPAIEVLNKNIKDLEEVELELNSRKFFFKVFTTFR